LQANKMKRREIFFSELGKELQRELLGLSGAKTPEENGWDTRPVAIVLSDHNWEEFCEQLGKGGERCDQPR